jgi:ABC-type Fe3+ transport system permease subunit
MFYTLAIFVIVAIWMQVKSNRKNADVYDQTRGVIKSRQDLLAVKSAISLSMRLAVIYIVLFVLFIMVLSIFVARGESLGHAALSLFVFGVVTLPVGLIGKGYEKRIKTMQVQTDDPEIAEKFQQYLKQWDKARFQLSD